MMLGIMKLKKIYEKEALKDIHIFIVKCLSIKKNQKNEISPRKRNYYVNTMEKIMRKILIRFYFRIAFGTENTVVLNRKFKIGIMIMNAVLDKNIKKNVLEIQDFVKINENEKIMQNLMKNSIKNMAKIIENKICKNTFIVLSKHFENKVKLENNKKEFMIKLSKIYSNKMQNHYKIIKKNLNLKFGLKKIKNSMEYQFYKIKENTYKMLKNKFLEMKNKQNSILVLSHILNTKLLKEKFYKLKNSIQNSNNIAEKLKKLNLIFTKKSLKFALEKFQKNAKLKHSVFSIFTHFSIRSQKMILSKYFNLYRQKINQSKIKEIIYNMNLSKFTKILSSKISHNFFSFTKSLIIQSCSELQINDAKLKNTEKTLSTTLNFISEKLRSKIRKLMGEFSAILSESLNKLQFALILRGSINSIGFENIHDSEILKIMEELYENEDENNTDKLISKILSLIVENTKIYIQWNYKNISQNIAKFIEKEFTTYDFDNSGFIRTPELLLIFTRIYEPGYKNMPTNIYNEFCKKLDQNGYKLSSVFNKEQTVAFLENIPLNLGKKTENHIIKIPHSRAKSSLTYLSENIRRTTLEPINENRDEKAIKRISSRLANIESKIDTLSRSQLETPQKMVDINDNSTNIIKSLISSKISQSRVPRLSLSHLTHKCNSDYCLICKTLYNN